jgi:hypothetical protein
MNARRISRWSPLVVVVAQGCSDGPTEIATVGAEPGDASTAGTGGRPPTTADGGGASQAPPPDPALLALVQPWIDAQCRLARTCCLQAGYAEDPLAPCEAEVLDQIPFIGSVLAGNSTIDAAAMDRCVAAFDDAATTCTYPERTATACNALWAGTLGEGEPCTYVADCARGDHPVICLRNLSVTGDVAGGNCHTMIRGGLGDLCVSSAYPGYYGATYAAAVVTRDLVYCSEADGLYCDFNQEGGTCAEIATEGAPCEGFDCATGLFCDGTCRPRGHIGDSCTAATDCARPLACEEGTCQERPVATDSLCALQFG